MKSVLGSENINEKTRTDVKKTRYKRTFLLCLVAVVLIIYLYYSYSKIMAENTDKKGIWASFDYGLPPADLMSRAMSVQAEKNTAKLNVQGIEVNLFYRTAGSGSKTPFLFLHGASFTSETWQNLGTIGLLSILGHKVVAVDLPGYGLTKRASNELNRSEFIKEVIEKTGITSPPVIVLPSMGGAFGLPYIMEDPRNAVAKISGIIAIASVGTDAYTHADIHRITVPTMIIRGEKDKGLGLEALSNLQNTENNIHFVMPNCGHAAYMNDSSLWHKYLYNYALGIEKEREVLQQNQA